MLTFVAAVPAATLPMQGWYRPGRFIPVRLAPGETSITGVGVIPTDAAALSREAVVPVLIAGFPTELHCGPATLPLHEAGPRDRLVASTGDGQQAGQALFPGAAIDLIPLDPADLLPGPPAAWGALDAIVLDVDTMRRLDDTTRATLLADGVLLACPGPVPPDLSWPWRRQGGRWVLGHVPAGLAGLIDPAAYAPTADWQAARPLALGRAVALVGLLLMLTAVSLALLLPRRWALPGVAMLAALATAGLLHGRALLGTLDDAGGDVFVAAGDGLAQRDIWLFQRARDDSPVTLPWSGDTRPVFDSPARVDRFDLHVRVDASQQLSFTYTLPAGYTLALRRSLVQKTLPALPDAGANHSPLRELAREDYLQPGQRIVGEMPAAPGRWNGVLIAR